VILSSDITLPKTGILKDRRRQLEGGGGGGEGSEVNGSLSKFFDET
jgi:hypothetical protein